MNVKELRSLLEKEQVLSVDLKFIDLNGEIRKVTISKDEVTEDLMTEGIGFDGSSVTGFRKVSAGDLVLIPELDTLHKDPFTQTQVYSLMCMIKEADTREQFVDDPRFVSKKAVKFLKDSNIADEAYFAPEYEFYLFSKVSYDTKSYYSFYHLDTEEGYWNNDFTSENDYLAIPQHKGYHRALPMDRYFEVRSDIINTMDKMNIKFRYHHHEVGGPSQHEIEVPLTPLFLASENCVWIKYIAKNIARRYGLFATFMPKPLSADAGSGMHCHIQLKKGGKNIFYGNEYAVLSQDALYFIGGILHHGPALAALTNPSVNSYKRLIPGFEAPTNLFFSLGNRSAAIRIPKYATSPEDARFEFRTPDATCNPYFAFPAILMAGIDGILNKIDPRKLGYGPFDFNIHDLSADEIKKIKSIPSSLEGSLNALAEDHDFLLKGDVFSKNFIDAWINTKTKELDLFRGAIDPLEFKMYFDC
ncbi:MAG: type I glutamate--ammonia ligase [Spirochaetes bacterium]|jgi:glutamine synthetase|nr:type I glutamate--ammonia ligase [Spirochaetota bacterium]NLJ05773.1 type I glutamate--ammonia ligase [Exilispira sp.]HOV45994.1 type I glutamate--ammonia ligase [Exilispira sp.]HQM89828.1 type I glutamate--ammonia ligase [Exilispira sp.]HQQ18715.1 type I glutamate--ammonia ligase [Exilispira sp.]